MKKAIVLQLLTTLMTAMLTAPSFAFAKDVVWFDGHNAVTYNIQKKADLVVGTAISMFSDDMLAVTGQKAVAASEKKASIRIIELDKASPAVKKQLQSKGIDIKSLSNDIDGFSISVINDQIVIVGSNGRGAAYGLLEMSRKAGVSPWVWWGDCTPEKKSRLTIDSDFKMNHSASVQYRGIFLNDEDWTTRRWSFTNYDKANFGYIGAKTYKAIFQLLLRLRANAIWPGMHPGTVAFFKVKGAKAVADSCGIVIGSSHCEPLLRNNPDEWDVNERGAYNFFTNRDRVKQYWAERLQEVKGSNNNMFTIGMRGIHDSNMEGADTPQKQFDGLQAAIDTQQELIRKYIGDPAKTTQVFVPYKEVLQIYEKGLKVPDYATLMWCDDNYGYMTRLSNADEQKRIGGGGIYYHLSYWGRPHDYLWLTTMQPGLIYNEMRQAYDHNVRKLWIVNVHDPKVAGYDLEMYLDMAWDIDAIKADNIGAHLQAWLCRQFGDKVGNAIYPAMYKYYRLTAERHPEFMGWTQVELDKKIYDRGLSQVRNTDFTHEFGDEMQRYLDDYAEIVNIITEQENNIRPELKDAYFAAIKYPVCCAALMAQKMLESQKARQWASGSTQSDMFVNDDNITLSCAKAEKAYEGIKELTDYYNKVMAGGKWNGAINMRPRDLPVFGAPVVPILVSNPDSVIANTKAQATTATVSDVSTSDSYIAHNACDYKSATNGTKIIDMLGHSMRAVALPRGGSVTYEFTTEREGKALLRTALIPTQANDNGDIRYAVSVDGGEEIVYSLKEPFRSEQWKQNVLRGQALRSLDVDLTRGHHALTIRALDDHIVLDQWLIDFNPNRKYYLFPVK